MSHLSDIFLAFILLQTAARKCTDRALGREEPQTKRDRVIGDTLPAQHTKWSANQVFLACWIHGFRTNDCFGSYDSFYTIFWPTKECNKDTWPLKNGISYEVVFLYFIRFVILRSLQTENFILNLFGKSFVRHCRSCVVVAPLVPHSYFAESMMIHTFLSFN